LDWQAFHWPVSLVVLRLRQIEGVKTRFRSWG